MMTRRALEVTLAGGVLPLLMIVSGCGGKESTASRSAAAYDEAQRKGIALGGSAHGAEEGHGGGGHDAQPSPESGTTAPAMPGTDNSGTGAKDGRSMAGMDHSSMPARKPSGRSATEHRSTAGTDHSGMAGMGAQSQPQTDPHAGMDHAKMPGMKPSGMSHDLPISPPSPEPLSASARPGQPAATLQPDPLDQPPPTSVADAARSAAMAAEMSGGGGHGMSHGTYTHVDAGRDTQTPSPKPSPQVKEHKH